MSFFQRPAAWLTFGLMALWVLILFTWMAFQAKPETAAAGQATRAPEARPPANAIAKDPRGLAKSNDPLLADTVSRTLAEPEQAITWLLDALFTKDPGRLLAIIDTGGVAFGPYGTEQQAFSTAGPTDAIYALLSAASEPPGCLGYRMKDDQINLMIDNLNLADLASTQDFSYGLFIFSPLPSGYRLTQVVLMPQWSAEAHMDYYSWQKCP